MARGRPAPSGKQINTLRVLGFCALFLIGLGDCDDRSRCAISISSLALVRSASGT